MLTKNRIIILLIFLAIFDLFIWGQIFDFGADNLKLYFLDVGQGDSELVLLPDNVRVLIDGGPNSKVLEGLDAVLPRTSRYIDLVILSHPQIDHFTGLIDVLKRYEVGAFIYNGQKGTVKSFKDLEKVLSENKTKVVSLKEGDKISYKENYFDVLYPNKIASDVNESGLVLKFSNPKLKALFTGDIGFKIEEYLAQKYDLDVDILKISHHGSKNSSSDKFLKEVSPMASVIEVGKNSYGHPTEQVLNRLVIIGSKIFRTDNNGNIRIMINDNRINIAVSKF